MQKIKSFEVDHTKISEGIYIQRIDNEIVTYDIRMVKPNTPPFLENAGLHTFEHLFATYVRNSKFGKNIIYVGPMGCRTGFYLLERNISTKDVIILVQESAEFIKNYSGSIPGATEKECGNYKEHDLEKAKSYATALLEKLKDWNEQKLIYPK